MSDPRRMDIDSVLKCPQCEGIPYKIFRRQNAQADGTLLPTFEHITWPTSPDVAPPTDPAHIVCPDCRVELKRVAS